MSDHDGLDDVITMPGMRIFGDFASKLVDCCHVYGITRRGYGASSQPGSGYDDQRLADDVLHVLDFLTIGAPVLVGHSMAGGELTTLGNQHSDRLAGLVYLDALGDPRDQPARDPAYMELLKKLPPLLAIANIHAGQDIFQRHTATLEPRRGALAWDRSLSE